MRNLKQIPGSKNCVAVVAAMAFNATVEEFEQEFKQTKSGGYKDSDFIKFALDRGYFVGLPFAMPDVTNNELSIRINVHDCKAYIVVKSEENNDSLHSIYWDGQKLWDPNPLVADNRPFSDYDIVLWYPIIKFIEK